MTLEQEAYRGNSIAKTGGLDWRKNLVAKISRLPFPGWGRHSDEKAEEPQISVPPPIPLPPEDIIVTNGHPEDGPQKDSLRDERAVVAEVLYGSRETNPISYADMAEIGRWRKHPSVIGHLYPRLIDSIEMDQEIQRVTQWEYYLGVKDANGDWSDPDNNLFFKALNREGEMVAVATLRLRGVPFLKGEWRTAYMERVIVDPELHDRGIGTVTAKKILDYALLESKDYQGGQPAVVVKASEVIGRAAGRFDINHNWFFRLGFEPDGKPFWVTNDGVVHVHPPGEEGEVNIQPWVLSADRYKQTRLGLEAYLESKTAAWYLGPKTIGTNL